MSLPWVRCFALTASLSLAQASGQACGDEVLLQYLDAGTTAPILRTPRGAPVLGGDFAFQVRDGAPGVLGVLLYSGFELPTFEPSLAAVVWPEAPWFTWFFGTGASGSSPLLIDTPEVTDDLCGAMATFQGFLFDASAPSGITVTNAVRLRVGGSTGPVFFTPNEIPAAGPPEDVALGDLNGDGRADMVTVDDAPWRLETWLGTPAGTFVPGTSTALGAPDLTAFPPRRVTLADLDLDGELDAVLTRPDIDRVVVFAGDGAGGFAAPVAFPAGPDPIDVEVGLIDGDAFPDLVVAQSAGSAVSVLLGDGAGAFSAPISWFAGAGTGGSGVFDVALADLDEDGALDVVAAVYFGDLISVLLGGGDGTFAAPLVTPTDDRPHRVALGDVDGDGHTDVVVGYDEPPFALSFSSARVHLGGGDGSLGPAESVGVAATVDLAVADLDGDSTAEILALPPTDISARTASIVTVLHRDGPGSYSQRLFTGFTGAEALAVGDFDGDDAPDALTARAALLGDGSGGLRAPEFGPTGVVADVDGDGLADLLSAGLTLRYGQGDGTLGPPVPIGPWVSATPVAVLDLDADGIADLVAHDPAMSAGFSVSLGLGGGAFGPSQFVSLPGANPVRFADLNADGFPDLTSKRSGTGVHEFYVLLGNGDGTFAAPIVSIAEVPRWGYTDLNGDDIPDLVLVQPKPPWQFLSNQPQDVFALLGMGTGHFDYAVLVGTFPPNEVHTLLLGDVDEDGFSDVVLGVTGSSLIYRSKGDGTFETSIPGPTLTSSGGALVDIDGDGTLDVVSVGSQLRVSRGLGDGTFGPALSSPVGGSLAGQAIGDFDGDGIPDLLLSNGILLLNLVGEE